MVDEMGVNSSHSALVTDRAFLHDQSLWIANVHQIEAEVVLGALEESQDRNRRKALSARLIMIRRDALLAIGLLYVAISRRRAESIAGAFLSGRASDVHKMFRRAGVSTETPFWEFVDLPQPSRIGEATNDPGVAKAYADSCALRARNLTRVGALARQDMMFAFSSSGLTGQILVDSPRTVSLLKASEESDLRDSGNTAFYVVDMSGGESAQADDLVAIACPTTPEVLDGIAADIAFVDGEAAETVALTNLVADAGLLSTN